VSRTPSKLLRLSTFLIYYFLSFHRAALDSESQQKVVESLQKAMERTKSMVMVTHRLGVIRSLGVTRVIVLDKGMIVEDGHPEDLLRKEDAIYAALAKEQGIVAKPNETLVQL
jgi:ABC-type multidrug transport system fused ATPase/permease subunit